jgi:hypothetical protein
VVERGVLKDGGTESWRFGWGGERLEPGLERLGLDWSEDVGGVSSSLE